MRLCGEFRTAVTPVLLALLGTALLGPLHRRLVAARVHRSVAAGLACVAVVAVVDGAGYVVAAALVDTRGADPRLAAAGRQGGLGALRGRRDRSGTVQMHPAVVMLAITAGATAAGILGMLLAVLLTAAAFGVVRELRARYAAPSASVASTVPPAPSTPCDPAPGS